MTRVFVAIYLVEAGLILAAAPWTTWWRRNYFADLLPWLRELMWTQGMQAAVVAVGVLTIAVGLTDLWSIFSHRFGRREAATDRYDS